MIRTIIIDDEPHIIQLLSEQLSLLPDNIEIIGTAHSVATGVELLNTFEPELVFLDVELPDGKGMDVLNAIEHRSFQLIFITAYEKYAIEAFRMSALQFLLKPIDTEELREAVGKAKDLLEKESLETQLAILTEHLSSVAQKIIIHSTESIHILELKDILYLNADGGYSNFVMQNGQTLLSSKRLKLYESLLGNKGFIRVHHSYLINVRHVIRYDRLDSMVILKNHIAVPVSQRRREVLSKILNGEFFL